ncbi:thioesterase domain-containing protein [Agrobacterium sp. SOY23]|uniref:thioesterase II family protein n=1 Tax=Agrobacterium sp. SOY23 TaxID=3014555 RepID=UPI0022B07AA7|nr:thioesterase domain-containing protein [Agrobacterium sp. SOY23]MCZ4431403.1 thioesterase domain-containing protein [Agrobacterium sp. SOY23]
MTVRPRLICLPPAGAGPSLFRSWVHSESIFDVFPVPLPGREAHFTKPLPRDIESLADHVAGEISGLLQAPYALFGYSMGAVVAYELLRNLSIRRLPLPHAFYILGSNAPDRVLEGREPIHIMSSEDFHQSLVEIGGTPEAILRDREAMALFEPVLRNDFRICETYEFTPPHAPVALPVHVFVADADHLVSWSAAHAWESCIGSNVTMHRIEGSHMLPPQAFAGFIGKLGQLWQTDAMQTMAVR